MTAKQLTLGVLGTGRLGRTLAVRLGEFFHVAAWDADVKKAKQFTKQHNLTFAEDIAQLLFCDLLLLCLPAPAVISFFRELSRERRYECAFLNLATGVDTPWLIEALNLSHLKIIGVKLIGQFSAIHQRIPLTLVTAHNDPQDLQLLEQVFHLVGGNLVRGDERRVQALNREATKLALRFGKQFQALVGPYACDPAWALSALHSVVVGTLLDYPPQEDNAYAQELLEELANEESLFGGVTPALHSPLLREVGK